MNTEIFDKMVKRDTEVLIRGCIENMWQLFLQETQKSTDMKAEGVLVVEHEQWEDNEKG